MRDQLLNGLKQATEAIGESVKGIVLLRVGRASWRPPLFLVKEPQSLALLPPKCQILPFYSSLMSAIDTSYFVPASPLEAGSVAGVSGRLF